MAPAIRQDVNLSAEAAPATAQSGLRLFVLGRARPCCPAARRTDPDRPAGAARHPGRTRPPSHRPISTSRIRAAARAQARPSVPSRAVLPRKDGNARPYLHG